MPIMAYDTEDSSRNADFLWTSPYGREGSGAFGARVLSFVCFAPNDGFGPQSGLVQRGVLYAAAWGSENRTTALTGEEMHSPFGGWRHHLARWEACHWIRGSRGSPMNPPLCCELLMKRVFRGVLFCPLHRGKSGEAG